MSPLRRLWGLVLGKSGHTTSVSVPSPSTTVLVVGAGSTGLAVAQGLKKAGISCIVLEKTESLDAQPRDWNMGLHWGAEVLKKLLPDEMWAQIQTVQVDPSEPTAENDALKFINAQSGEPISSVAVKYFYRLRRRKLRHLMMKDLDVRFGKKLQKLEYSADGKDATAFLQDGSSIKANLVVGTDGARSTVRQLLLGEKGTIRTLPYCASFVQARYTAEQAKFLRQFHPLYLAGINPAGYFAFFGVHDVEDPARPETWTFFFYISWHSPIEEQQQTADWTNAQRLKQVKAFATRFTDPWKSAFEWLSDDQEVWYMSLTDFDPGAADHRWESHGGRVTLAGDAAHPMTYQRGQGLNHSVTDAGKLAEAIQRFVSGEATQGAAITGYEEEMIRRAGGEVRMSTLNTEMMHDWEKVRQSPIMKSGMTAVQAIKTDPAENGQAEK